MDDKARSMLALEQAGTNLERALRATTDIGRAQSAGEIVENWSDFLIAYNRAFNKIGAAMSTGASAAWFGTKKHERKVDPLLGYLHQARDADEHGIERITGLHSSHLTLAPGAVVTLTVRRAGEWEVVGATAGGITLPRDRVALVAVSSRGVRYDVPKYHLNAEIKDPSPYGVAVLALKWLGEMFAEAERRTHSAAG